MAQTDSIGSLLAKVVSEGRLREREVRLVSMGRERVFHAYDVARDTFIFEDGIASRLAERPSILIVPKASLDRRHGRGWVVTFSTGNHSTAAFPLLDGRFWGLSSVRPDRRSATLAGEIVCANAIDGAIEVFQRDVPTARIIEVDGWLSDVIGLPLHAVVYGDRNPEALEYFRKRGQEWRVKPLAWTEKDIRIALEASRKAITVKTLTYYHSNRGIHFLAYPDFAAFAELAKRDFEAFKAGLREMVGLFEGNQVSFMRLLRHRGHHEVELFGLPRGLAELTLVPELEKLTEAIALGRIGQKGAANRIAAIVARYVTLLTDPELQDPESKLFRDTMYMHITGEVYAVMGIGTTPAFDGRRTALPGATFANGRPVFHRLSDARTRRLITNIRHLLSKDEEIEYANVYELHGVDETVKPGAGATREISYKTNRSPVPRALVEKRLSRSTKAYSGYMLSRVQALKALGIQLSSYRILKAIDSVRQPVDYYIRHRCEGFPLPAIPKSCFASAADSSVEDEQVVIMLATLMGDAAAQNMAMRKYDPEAKSALFGIGKEIYDFQYDLIERRFLPKSVSTCSIRGSFGWPCLDRTEANLRKMENFYFTAYACALVDFRLRHEVPIRRLAECFYTAFESRTYAINWQATVIRDRFLSFDPGLPAEYRFRERLEFILWAMEGQQRRLDDFKRKFMKLTEELEHEHLRRHSK